MGIKQYLLADALKGVVNQKLIGRVCPHCSVETVLPKDSIYRKAFDIPEDEEFIYNESVGCEQCRNTGYKGRVLLSECLPITPEIRKLVEDGADLEKHLELLHKEGYRPLRFNALERVKEGVTDFKEVLYV